MIFEVCAINIQSALAAERAGAHRIELCSALDAGGLTPSMGLIRAAVQNLSIPVQVLIRPREGDFCYNALEWDLMLEDVRLCREAGAAGVVVGGLKADATLDLPYLAAIKAVAGPMEITCHRAFDYVGNPVQALEALIDLGFTRVLSSGQAASAFTGRFVLQKMVAQSNHRIAVMPGAGIQANNIRAIAEVSGATEFHFTGKKKVFSTAKNELPGLAAWHWESDEAEIRSICASGLEATSAPDP